MTEFKKYGKTPRLEKLFENVIITEKIDGTNASIKIENSEIVYAGSRNRIITPEDDNFGFAKWVEEKRDELVKLGDGVHFGEWFGEGIQKNPLGVEGKRWALFNVNRWEGNLPNCVETVPVIYTGPYEHENILFVIGRLRLGSFVDGSSETAKPEGLVTYFPEIQQVAKWTFENQKGKWNA